MNRAFFTLFDSTQDSTVTYVNNVFIYDNFNLQRIIPYLFWNYTVFNIKLESFQSRTSGYNTLIDQQYNLLHLSGLPFVNGFDTQSGYENSRVIELISYEQNIATINRGYNFISDCNQIMFFRPSTPQVTLQLFMTNVVTGAIQPFIDRGAFIFSITGIEKYRVQHFKRFKEIRSNEINFVLKTSSAIQLDNRNRAMKWNVNMREVMGSNYDEYTQFKLVTQNISTHQGAINPVSYSGFFVFAVVMSGLPWMNSSVPYINIPLNTTTGIYHKQQRSVVGLSNIFNRSEHGMYIENYIDRPQMNSDIVITYSSVYGDLLIGASAGVTTFTNLVLQFIIIPLK